MVLYIPFPEWINPEVIPGLPFQWYGVMYLIAFALTWFLTRYQIREQGLDISDNQLIDFFFWGIVGLLVGARLFATLIFDETWFYWRNPHRIVIPFDDRGNFTGLQGMNFYGGLLGAVVGFGIYARVKRLDLLRVGDMIVAGVPLGYTFGRIGNFINGELFGRVTTVSWGVVFTNARRFSVTEPWVRETMEAVGMPFPADPAAMVNLPRHPTQLYEGFTEGIFAWLVIWFFVRKRIPYRGFVVAFYVLWYGAWRFLIDYFRMPLGSDYWIRLAADPAIPPYRLLSPWNLIASQAWSGLMILAGAGFMVAFAWWERRRQHRADAERSARVLLRSRNTRRKLRSSARGKA